jgi:hypothetical protein
MEMMEQFERHGDALTELSKAVDVYHQAMGKFREGRRDEASPATGHRENTGQ